MVIQLTKRLGTRVQVLALPRAGLPADPNRTAFLKRILVEVQPEPWMLPDLTIPIIFETRKEWEEPWSDLTLRLPGSRTAVSLAVAQTIPETLSVLRKTPASVMV
jgi:hypothetical protein